VPGIHDICRRIRRHCLIIGLPVLISPAIATADLTDIKVYSPLVEKDERELEIIGNATFDDDAQAHGSQHHEFELGFGLTERWATSLTASLIKPAGDSLRYDIVGWENTIQLAEEGQYWVDLGVHFEIELEDEEDRANNLEFRFILERTAGGYQHTVNVNIEQQWGRHAQEDLEIEYIWRSRRIIAPHVQAGFEAFGDLGELADIEPLREQEHRVGPALYYDLELGSIALEGKLAWLFGLTPGSADHTLHWQMQFQF